MMNFDNALYGVSAPGKKYKDKLSTCKNSEIKQLKSLKCLKSKEEKIITKIQNFDTAYMLFQPHRKFEC